LYDGKNEIHQRREAKIIKEASEQGVKQTLEKYPVFSVCLKRKWKQWAKRVFSWNDPRPTKRIRELEKKISC
jgi:hypothetical protein